MEGGLQAESQGAGSRFSSAPNSLQDFRCCGLIFLIYPISRHCFHSRGRWRSSGGGWRCGCTTVGVHAMPLSCALKSGENGQFYVVCN